MSTKKGFTLMEIMITVAIIGLISSIILFQASKARSLGRDGQRAGDISRFTAALGLYFADNIKYPATLSSLVPTYMSALPVDPISGNSYVYAGIDTNGVAASCDSYHIGAIMENTGFNGLKLDRDAPKAASICTGSAADFNGNATNCSGNSAAVPDACFDAAP
jgi:prepilin-type N-terminal cleavage/methylation domain-containing protein